MIRKGDTLLFDAPPTVAAWAAAGGKKESEGPLASAFDFVTRDAGFGEQGCENWEQAESILQRKAAELCLRKADIPRTKVDIAFAGDLQAQCTASNYTMRELGVPFAGVYGACSTMAETLGLAAAFAASGMAERAMALTSSHFAQQNGNFAHHWNTAPSAPPRPSGRPQRREPAWCGRTAGRACRCSQ